jgi:hypothetical protein
LKLIEDVGLKMGEAGRENDANLVRTELASFSRQSFQTSRNHQSQIINHQSIVQSPITNLQF